MTMKFLWSAWTVLLLLHAVSGDGQKCEYQGKTYSEGEDLPTHRLCLNCKCTPDFVEPNNRVCTVIDCPKNDAGCIPVYNDTECCPVSYNCEEKVEAIAKCDERYLRHYEVKGCTPVFEEGSECPKKFNCPKDIKVDYAGCQFHGHLYKIGDNIDTGNPCQICSCQRGWEGPEIKCVVVECPNDLGPPLNSSCREVYEPGKCCAARIECDAEGKQNSEKTCEYGGKTYRLGEKIYPKDDPCLICRCTEDWTGINENSCQIHNCALENNRKKLAEDCLPIYHEATCCPIGFFCGNASLNRTAPLPSAQDIESGNFCEFKGNRYRVGDVLRIKHRTNCVTCTCLTPPDFTCVHKKCPPPPNDDYENCIPVFAPGECCPTYVCRPKEKCPFIVCGTFCRKVTGPDGCSICVCNGPCTPPDCDIGCQLEYDRSAGPCPYCVCYPPNSTDLSAAQCSPPSCGPGCIINYATKPCPSCACPGTGSVQCSSTKCNSGCTLDRKTKPCPVCKCKNSPAPQCSPVACESHCQEVQGSDGCPSCQCPECIIPKCGTGCILDNDAKPCPICVCDRFQSRDSSHLFDPSCSNLKCGPGCQRVLNTSSPSERCPICKCSGRSGEHLTCAAKQCEHPCEFKRFSEHGCPTCICDPSNLLACPPLDCGPGGYPELLPFEMCPHCIYYSSKDNSGSPGLRDDGCPDDSLCQKSCRNRGKKSGKCSGNTCVCH